MSNVAFAELASADPVERGIARRALRILNDTSLNRAQRETLVRRAQLDLLAHRAATARRQALFAVVKALQLPKGFKALSVQVQGAKIQVGAMCKHKGFAWFDAGEMPAGLDHHQAAVRLPKVNPKEQRESRVKGQEA